MTRAGPPHRVAGKSAVVSFWFLAQRTKFPVGPRWLRLAAAIHSSRLAWVQLARVRSRAASQSSNATAAQMLRRGPPAPPRGGGGAPGRGRGRGRARPAPPTRAGPLLSGAGGGGAAA